MQLLKNAFEDFFISFGLIKFCKENTLKGLLTLDFSLVRVICSLEFNSKDEGR